jgi:hypothetical protein
MSARVLQMKSVPAAAPSFRREVGTVEASVNFDVWSFADEDGSNRLCVIDLPNPGPHGGLCRALLAREHVAALIDALNAYEALS